LAQVEATPKTDIHQVNTEPDAMNDDIPITSDPWCSALPQ